MIFKLISIVLLCLTSGAPATAQSRGPVETVVTFYKFSNARLSTFDRRHIESRREWYTPALYRAFLEQLREDELHLKKNPTEKPFFGDGLYFRPLDEPCYVKNKPYRRYQAIARKYIRKSRAYIDVKFASSTKCTDGGEPIYYRVNLLRIQGNG